MRPRLSPQTSIVSAKLQNQRRSHPLRKSSVALVARHKIAKFVCAYRIPVESCNSTSGTEGVHVTTVCFVFVLPFNWIKYYIGICPANWKGELSFVFLLTCSIRTAAQNSSSRGFTPLVSISVAGN